jgi:SAM-dependent methyltransferase
MLRQAAESFGSEAERYDRARPRYPEVLVQRIVNGSPGPIVLDVGCGTGIAARQFRTAGCQVLGVEPDIRMANLARRHGLEVEVTSFEAWDAAGRAFDIVVAGQSWHWIDPLVGAAKAAQVMRPSARLAVFWNVSQPPPSLRETWVEIYRGVLPEMPFSHWVMPGLDAYVKVCDKAADGIRETESFTEPEQWTYDWERSVSRDELLDQLPTLGACTRIPPSRLRRLCDRVGAAIDAAGGDFTMRYTTIAVTALKGGTVRQRSTDASRVSG